MTSWLIFFFRKLGVGPDRQGHVAISDRTKYDLAISSAVKWQTEAISGIHERTKYDLTISSATKWALSIFDRSKYDLDDDDSGDPYG